MARTKVVAPDQRKIPGRERKDIFKSGHTKKKKNSKGSKKKDEARSFVAGAFTGDGGGGNGVVGRR